MPSQSRNARLRLTRTLSDSVIYMVPPMRVHMRDDSARWYSAFFAILFMIVVAGCTSSPTAPLPSTTGPNLSPQASPTPYLAGMVINSGGACIRGATVESIAGQAVGQKVVQTGECDVWSYGGGGFTFKDLTPGILMTLRASAPGFVTTDVSGVGPGLWNLEIELERLPVQ